MLQYKVTVKKNGVIMDKYSLYGERKDVIKVLKKKYNCNLTVYRTWVEVDVIS